jgi:alpha-galactosidase
MTDLESSINQSLQTQTLNVSEAKWFLPGNYRVLTNGYQSRSEAEVRHLGTEQPCPTLSALIAQGHDQGFPPSGQSGIWRSHGLIALLGSDHAMVGYVHSARSSATQWEAKQVPGGLELRVHCDGKAETVTLERTENPIETLEACAKEFAQNMNARIGASLRVWTSRQISQHELTFESFLENARFAKTHNLPFDVFQLDAGYEAEIGDWLEMNRNFNGQIRDIPPILSDLGFESGLWLAPFIASPYSNTFRKNPHWFIKDDHGNPAIAGDNWGGAYHAFDCGQTEVLEWLEDLAFTCSVWGFTYLKLDALFAGMLPGVRASGVHRVEAYRLGLEAIRRGAENAYIVGCGAPLLQSVGIVDAMRIGPDSAPIWDDHSRRYYLRDGTGPSARNALHTCLTRWYQHSWYRVDSDLAFFSERGNLLSCDERDALEALVDCCAGLRSNGDTLAKLDGLDLERLRAFLERVAEFQKPVTLETPDGAPVEFENWSFNLSGQSRDGVAAHAAYHRPDGK